MSETEVRQNNKYIKWALFVFTLFIFVFIGFNKSLYGIVPATAIVAIIALIKNKISFFEINKTGLIIFFVLVVYMFCRPVILTSNYKLAQLVLMLTIIGFSIQRIIPRSVPYFFCVLPIILAIHTVIYIMEGSPIGIYPFEHRWILEYSNPNYLGNILMFSISSILLMFKRFNISVKIVMGIVLLICFYALAETGCKTALLGTVFVFFYVIISHLSKKKLFIALGAFIILLLSLLMVSDSFKERIFVSVSNPLAIIDSRYFVWCACTDRLIKDPSLWGYPTSIYKDLFLKYQDEHENELLKDYSPERLLYFKNRGFANSHNTALGIIYKFGIIGAILFIALLVDSIRNFKGNDYVFQKGILIMVFILGMFEDLTDQEYLFTLYIFLTLGMGYGIKTSGNSEAMICSREVNH